MIVTALTEIFGVRHPIALGPTGSVSGGHLSAALETERAAYQVAAREGDYDKAVVRAGEAVDLIKCVEGAAALVARISAEAEVQLRAGGALAR